MKKIFSCLLIIGVLFLIVPTFSAQVSTSARAYALYCVNNGKVLLSNNPDAKLPMASTTKIMTALLTLENMQKENRVVEFTEEMTAEGSSMYLKVGEKVRLYDLAVGMMMQSGNDAANAAAIAIDGSIEKFADRMNRKAAEIGMKNTHFVTPSGLDDEEHYSTAYDMAVLMAYALKNRDFRKMTAQKSMTVNFVKPSDKRVTYPNHNRLLSLYESCIGGKTGYTMTAGRCLVTAAERDGLTLVAVTLDDRDDWDDHMALYDYGFESFAALTPDKTADHRLPVVGGATDEAAIYAKVAEGIVVPRDRMNEIKTTVVLPPFLYAPIQAEHIIGRVQYELDGEMIGASPLMCADTIDYNDRKRGFFEYISDMLNL